MRFNWNGVIQTVGLLTDQPDVQGPIKGKGFQVKRNPKKGKKQQFVVIVTEGDYDDPGNDKEKGNDGTA